MSDIHFGTDGWRGVIGDDFTFQSVRAVAGAAAEVFARDVEGDLCGKRMVVGYDMRFEADSFAAAVAEVLAQRGFDVLLSDRPLPTPGVCYCVAHDDNAVGGLMLTASHNPSKWLGIKVRMTDGGASPASFTDRIEELLDSSEAPSVSSPEPGKVFKTDLVGIYLEGIHRSMARFTPPSTPSIEPIKIIIDPMYGADQGLLADLMREQGVEVVEIHAQKNPGFGGLHPEPIAPWTDEASAAVIEHDADGAFIVDGDGDRIGAIDEHGTYITPHRILGLLIQHLVEDLGRRGRVVKTLALSKTIDHLCEQLDIPLDVRPIGFKWVYEEMLKGDVLIGGEESGGIGIAEHVLERDGMLMALLLLQMMRVRNKTLGELVADFEAHVGNLHYKRRDLKLDEASAQRFREELVHESPTEMAGKAVRSIDRLDGLKLVFDDDEWLLLRGSGTEPLIRIYSEANTPEQLDAYLEAGSAFARGENA